MTYHHHYHSHVRSRGNRHLEKCISKKFHVGLGTCCFILILAVAPFALGITALVFFGKLATDERGPLIASYTDAINSWANGSATAFTTSPQRNFTVVATPVSASMGPVAGAFSLPPSQYPDPFRCTDTEGDVPSSSTFASYHVSPSPGAPTYALPGNLSSTVQLALYLTPQGGGSAALLTSLSLPVWRTASYAQTCKSSSCSSSSSSRKCTRSCSCDNSGRDNGDGTCSLWFQLSEVCVVVDPRGGADTLSNPPGCALTGSSQMAYLGSGAFDTAAWSSSSSPPTAGVFAFAPSVTVRSSADPLVQLLRLTGGTLVFPMSQAKKLMIGISCVVPAIALGLAWLFFIGPLFFCEALLCRKGDRERVFHRVCPCCYHPEHVPPPPPAKPMLFSLRGASARIFMASPLSQVDPSLVQTPDSAAILTNPLASHRRVFEAVSPRHALPPPEPPASDAPSRVHVTERRDAQPPLEAVDDPAPPTADVAKPFFV